MADQGTLAWPLRRALQLRADEVAVIDHGRIVAQGTPRELMHGEQDSYVSELMATPRRQAEKLKAALERRDGAR